MAIDTPEQVRHFLILQQKSAAELRALCEGLQLDTTGEQSVLLDRLMQLGATPQNDVIKPQLIPLRTRDERGNPMEAAYKAIYHWRGQIFNAKDNYKEFKMMNASGGLYSLKMRYIMCPEKILQKVLTDKWYDPQYMGQTELIDVLMKNPEKFNVAIVQRPSTSGKSYIMLHAEAKAA